MAWPGAPAVLQSTAAARSVQMLIPPHGVELPLLSARPWGGRQQVGLAASLAAVSISALRMEGFPGDVWKFHLQFPEALQFAAF